MMIFFILILGTKLDKSKMNETNQTVNFLGIANSK